MNTDFLRALLDVEPQQRRQRPPPRPPSEESLPDKEEEKRERPRESSQERQERTSDEHKIQIAAHDLRVRLRHEQDQRIESLAREVDDGRREMEEMGQDHAKRVRDRRRGFFEIKNPTKEISFYLEKIKRNLSNPR